MKTNVCVLPLLKRKEKKRNSHYEKSSMGQLKCLATTTPKQLIFNYVITILCKYGEFINKISHWKTREL